MLGIPTPEYIHNEFALGNIPDIVSYTRSKFPDWKITIAHRDGVRTDANRNHILQKAIEDGTVDYILWLDADMLYPANILERYFESLNFDESLDVIGCLYFKRSFPHHPVAYMFSGLETKPYKTILPSVIRDDIVYEIDGIGYGGMMVGMHVYEKLGKKKWTVYGENFHLPYESPNHMTHDLVFCWDVKKAGMSVKLHGGVRPGHISAIPITIDHWKQNFRKDFSFKTKLPKVLCIMPTTNEEMAVTAGNIMRERAGADFDLMIVKDDQRVGFIKIVNEVTRHDKDHEVIIYTAQDVFVGKDWLRNALMDMIVENAGLIGFNDGKWGGKLASFGMVLKDWVKDIYGGNIFHEGYFAHYADTELTQIAKQQGRYHYSETAVMMEIDYQKALGQGKGVVQADKKLYKKRKQTGFNGLVTDEKLLQEFS